MYRFPLFLLLLSVVFSSCSDPDQNGCTDPLACNYDASAMKDDGSCTLCTTHQEIWAGGNWGAWNGNSAQGAIVLEVCEGSYSIFSTLPVLPDTTANDTISSDTIPADTIPVDPTPVDLPRDTVLQLWTNENGQHLSYFTLLNSQNGQPYTEGSLRFSIKKASTTTAEVIRVFIDGNIHQNTFCGSIMRSGYVDISSHAFTDSAFTEVSIPIRDFADISTGDIHIVSGFKFNGPDSTGFEFRNIRWSTSLSN